MSLPFGPPDGGVLSGPQISIMLSVTRAAREAGRPPEAPWLWIDPFRPENCGPNSYDLTLGDEVAVYRIPPGGALDMRLPAQVEAHRIPHDGMVLYPGTLYLGTTVEHTECHGLVPWIDGRSSVGRLGLSVHVTAGRGDDGFCGQWTLEMTCVHPVRVYAGERIAQLTLLTLIGPRRPYAGKYQHQRGVAPSRMHADPRKSE